MIVSSRSIPLALALALTLGCVRSVPAASPEESEAPVELVITPARSDFRVGESPAFEVRLRNRGTESVILPGCLDGSEWRGIVERLPRLDWSVEGPPDGWSLGELGYCGLTNELRPEDLVEVLPGGEFDPYARVDDYGFFASAFLSTGTFARPGRYEFTLRYSTESTDGAEEPWRGTDERLALVPRVTLVARVSVDVAP